MQNTGSQPLALGEQMKAWFKHLPERNIGSKVETR